MEQVTRFELVLQPWQGRVLPLYYTCTPAITESPMVDPLGFHNDSF